VEDAKVHQGVSSEVEVGRQCTDGVQLGWKCKTWFHMGYYFFIFLLPKPWTIITKSGFPLSSSVYNNVKYRFSFRLFSSRLDGDKSIQLALM
jgi:hypothetical protein